jgi:hypothetical protein
MMLIAAPVHNRDNLLHYYLDGLNKLYLPDEIQFLFLANNCSSPALQLLNNFASDHPCFVVEDNSLTSTIRRNGLRYRALAKIRNRLREEALKISFTHMFSVDSDIILPPQALAQLITYNLDAVSGLVYNDLHLGGKRETPDKHMCNILNWSAKKDKQGYPKAVHIRNYPPGELIPVDITGACVLLSRKVVEQVEYTYHPQGEDLGWAINLQRRGFQAFCDTSLRPRHLMTTTELNEYRSQLV